MKCYADSYCKKDRSECSELCGGYRVLRALYTLSRIPVRYQYNIALKPELKDVKAFEELNIPADVTCMNSGPLGGDAEIAALVVRHQVDLAIFLIDDLNPQPHEADIQMLLRQCRVHNVPIACNRYSADLMITSTLWDDDSYVPSEPKYIYFKR